MLRLPRDTVLMPIDFQHAIDHPKWGRRNNPEAETVTAGLLGLWRERGLPILHIRHDSVEPRSPYRPGQPGHMFKPEVAPKPGEPVIGKSTTSAFVGTDLEELLEAGGHTTLVVCGVLTQNSVEATVRHAGNLGFRVIVAQDGCAATDVVDLHGRLWLAEDVHALSLANLSGEYAEIAGSGRIAAAIARGERPETGRPAVDLCRCARQLPGTYQASRYPHMDAPGSVESALRRREWASRGQMACCRGYIRGAAFNVSLRDTQRPLAPARQALIDRQIRLQNDGGQHYG
eukprot:gene19554-19990_t